MSSTPGARDLPGWEARWRISELEQLVLDDARVLWQRFVEETRQDAMLRCKQLSILAKLSAILAGFSMSSFLEFNFDPSEAATGVLVAYGVTTTLVAAIYMCCLATCNLIEGTVQRVSSTFISEEEESHHIMKCREFAIRFRRGDLPPAPPRSFRRWWDVRCAPSWRITLLLFAAGVPLFLVNMAFSAWIKFIGNEGGAIMMTAIMAGSLAYLAAAGVRWITHLVEAHRTHHHIAQPEMKPLGLPWDWHNYTAVYPNALSYTGPVILPAFAISPQPADSEDYIRRRRIEEDMEQQHLENALQLWDRFERGLKTDMNDKAEQLRDTSFLAGIMLSFGMAALYQLTFEVTQYPGVLNILYALTVALTVSLNLCTLTVCGFLNMGIVKAGASLGSQEERAHFLSRAAAFARNFRPGDRPPLPPRSLAKYWAAKCEQTWRTAFGAFLAGAVVFQLCLISSAWLKFMPRIEEGQDPRHSRLQPAVAMTAIQGVGVLCFCFICLKWSGSGEHLRDKGDWRWGARLPSVGLPFDWHLPPFIRPVPQMTKQLPQPAEAAAFRASPESPYVILLQDSYEDGIASMGEDTWQAGGLWAEHLEEHRHLRNARGLWSRFYNANANDLEERAEQLTAVTDLAAIISGFEMIAFLQFTFDVTTVSKGLQFAYVATSGLTVATMATAMTLSGVMLESILESSPGFVSIAQEADFMANCHRFCHEFRPGDAPPAPRRSFKAHWDTWCKNEWHRAFRMFSLGVPLFLANAAITSWIKFERRTHAAKVVTVLQGLAVAYLVISQLRWAKHIVSDRPTLQGPKARLAPMGLPFDWHLPPKPVLGSRRASQIRGSRL